MQNIKKIITLIFLGTSTLISAQIVDIPDANFKAKLLEADVTNTVAKDLSDNYFKIDANNDGEIQESEALQVSYLDVIPTDFNQTLQIADMQGLGSFVNLIFLDCTYNSFASLDTSSNVNLEVLKSRISLNLSSLNINNNVSLDSLDIASSQLSNLDLSANTNLRYVDISSNSLSSIDISNNVNLEVIYCTENQLTSLDFSSNNNIQTINAAFNELTSLNLNNATNLTYLNCNGNNLVALDVSDAISLINIDCDQNQIANLDFTNNINVEHLSCFANQINSLNVTTCSNLNYLLCANNQLNSLDVSNNTNLVNLLAYDNMLTILDLVNNVDLEYLYVFNNQLSDLNFGNNSSLVYVDCNNNQLNTLDITNLFNLLQLRCNDNLINNIDFSNNSLLDQINISNNQLITIDISNNSNLYQLFCSNNVLSSLNVSANLDLRTVNCANNQLTTLDFSNNPILNLVNFSGNINLTSVNVKNGSHFMTDEYDQTNLPNLQFVCADYEEILDLESYFSASGVFTSVSSYCSFTPGGDYNTITGAITFDSQNDGCDVLDDVFPFIKININDGTDSGSTFTNYLGEYNFYTLAGDFLITPDIENPTFFNITPIQAALSFLTADNGIATQDFCITANGIRPDVEIVLAPTIPARPGFDAQYVITYKNKGNQTLSGDFSLVYDDTVLDYVSSTEVPIVETTSLLTWDYTSLLPFESRSVYITLNVNAPTETPPVNIGDVLSFTTTINPIAGDELPLDNQFDFEQTVIGSYDPNDITCIEGDVVEPSYIGEYLHYIINFENTGTDFAENIVVKMEINPAQFNINSLRLLSTSHNAEIRINGNIVEIIFESINMATGGHGNILLKVQSQDGLQEDDTVTEKADIYFDYNFPIETNDANTTFALLSTTDFELDNSIKIFPNPVNNMLNISARGNIKSISLYDVQGRLLQTKLINTNEITLEMSSKASGVYFVKIVSEKGTRIEKIIKQ